MEFGVNELQHVSIIIPVYNEGSIIAKNLDTLCDFMKHESYEILVCNDCSQDKTHEILAIVSEKHPSIRPLHFNQRIGKGGTIKAAIEKAKGDIIVIMDVDLATDLRHITELIGMAETNRALIIGERNVHDRLTQGYSRVLLSLGYNLLVRLLFRTGIADHQCGFKGLRNADAKMLIQHVMDNGFSFDTELILRARKFGPPIMKISVRWREKRPKGKSRFKPLRTTLTMAVGLIAIALRQQLQSH